MRLRLRPRPFPPAHAPAPAPASVPARACACVRPLPRLSSPNAQLEHAAVTAAILGGIGLFLLGMVLLSDGLKAAAGDALRSMLVRFTGGRLRALLSGFAVTAVVQSSSATVLMTIGFVSAGLLTFTHAVGVVFGASVGTTSTGWIVSLLGLKLDISVVALPLVGIGALLRLLTRGRSAAIGLALAGFGLIFVGIDVLRDGMQELSLRIDPAIFPPPTFVGTLMLAGIGVVMTVLTQSSSAAVATTLTALHTGTIGLEQAAALVIGQHMGTTITAAIASIGASVAARRTAFAHILFNTITGVIAFVLLPLLLALDGRMAERAGGVEPAVLIAAFHTTFTTVGVLLLLPVAGRFAGFIERLIPERGPQLTRHLDRTVAQVPALAVDAARRTVMEIGAVLVRTLRIAAARPVRSGVDDSALDAAGDALDAVRRFLSTVRSPEGRAHHELHLSVLHAIDHLERLAERLRFHTPRRVVADDEFDRLRARAAAELVAIERWLAGLAPDAPTALAEALSGAVAERRRNDRSTTLQSAATGGMDSDAALRKLEATRWLDSSLYHVWRAVYHLAQPQARSEVELAN
jgi:phosphate:Na+ symporter